MRVLAISPHTDDVELGAGGTLTRLMAEGHEVNVLALSTGHPSTGSNKQEFEAAMKTLEIDSFHLKNIDCRKFPEYRQEILDIFIVAKQNIGPDLVFVPSRANIHQDHEVVTAEAYRAFRECSVLGYEMPWGDVGAFQPQLYARLMCVDIVKKASAVEWYVSQRKRSYVNEEFVYSLARMRGAQVNADFAEAFEVLRWIY